MCYDIFFSTRTQFMLNLCVLLRRRKILCHDHILLTHRRALGVPGHPYHFLIGALKFKSERKGPVARILIDVKYYT